MNPVIFKLGFIEIRWYSVLILLAFVIGYMLIINRCKKKNIPIETISDMCFYLIIVCIIGARIYFCAFNFREYTENIFDVFKIWEGGLAIHGGIISGIIFMYFYCKKKKLDLLEVLGIFAPALVLGQAIGRWGNFFNSEAYGRAVDVSYLKGLHLPQFIIDNMFIKGEYHHPTFLYESIGCVLIFITLIIIRNNKKINKGQIVGIYCVLYGILRFFVEGFRTDSLMFFNLRIAQVVSIIMFIIGLLLIIRPLVRFKNDK